MKKNSDSNLGENHPFFGKHHSDKTKRQMSDVKKGKHHSEKHKQKNSDAHKGIFPSEKTKQKLSDAKKGERHPLWKGGYKLKIKRQNLKRRKLGFNLINEPLSDDEVAHHLTKEFVAYVPEFINKSVYHNIHIGKNMDEVNFYTLNYLFLIYNKGE